MTNGRRDLAGFRVWHDAGDGNVNDFFDTSLLKQGKDHHLWDNRGEHIRLMEAHSQVLTIVDHRQCLHCDQTPQDRR